jgi:hypothetical protein
MCEFFQFHIPLLQDSYDLRIEAFAGFTYNYCEGFVQRQSATVLAVRSQGIKAIYGGEYASADRYFQSL